MNDKNELLAMALRAKKLGMDLMVDFHYADSWADPSQQPIPAAWQGHSFEQMKNDLRQHTIDVLNLLNKKSGMLGMSGVSSDFRDVEAARAEGNHRAEVALEAFRYRVAKYIGAYTAAMNGVDAIAFTAGVGENDKNARKLICDYLGYLGVVIDDEANNVRGKNAVISAPESKVKVMLIPTNEELAIARETVALAEK